MLKRTHSKWISLVIIMAVCLSMLMQVGTASAAMLQHERGIRVFAGGQQINFDVQPMIMNGHTLIPIRQIAATLGLPANDVQWNANGTVTINNGSSRMIIRNNEQQVYFNGKDYDAGASAQIVNGRMMVPLRAISQLFNKNVQWDSNSETITIN